MSCQNGVSKTPGICSFLDELRRAKIHYRLSQHRDDASMVEVAVPGQRWEVEFLQDGSVEVEVFRSDGTIYDAAALAAMMSEYEHAITCVRSICLSMRIKGG